LALARSLDTLSDHVDAILYGEAADTYFGLGAVHEIVEADRLTSPLRVLPPPIQKLIAKLMPNRGYRMRRIKTALAEGIDSLIYGIEKIPYSTPPWEVFPCARETVHDQALKTHLAHDSLPVGDRAAIQLLATGVMNHIENTGRLATYYGIDMYVPFVLNDVRSVAERIPFGLQNNNGIYKRVLRELACRYFDPEYIYTEKFGFPTPTKSWLNGPLKERVDRARAGIGFGRDYYSSRALFLMSTDKDYEHFWFAICLDELLEQLNSQAEALRVAA
jgi:asparagine synthase (glutamine-hydrolysing)